MTQKIPVLLLIEDEAQQRDVLKLMFEAEGYNVVGAETAEEGLMHIKQTIPDVVVTDVKLPGIDGFTFFEQVRNNMQLNSLPFIFITGYNDPAVIKRIKQFDAVSYVTKPYDLSDLMITINNLLLPGKKRL
jgi:two-component system, OmpR family, phosphate regulon response regulator PhoB